MYNIIRLVWNSGECYLKLLVLLKETVIFFGQSFGLFLHGVQIWVWLFQSCRKANRRGSFVCNLFSRMSDEWPVLTICAALELLRQSLHLSLQQFVLFWILSLPSFSFTVCKCLRMTTVCSSITEETLSTPVPQTLQ